MTKHNERAPYAHNSREYNQNNKDARKKGNGTPRTLSQADRENVDSTVKLVQEAFAKVGKKTTVIDVRVGKFKTRHIGVRPVDSEGKLGFGFFGFESDWLTTYKKAVAISTDKDVQVAAIIESRKFQSVLNT